MFSESAIQDMMQTYGISREGATRLLEEAASFVAEGIRRGSRLLEITAEEAAQMDACARSGDEIPAELEAKILDPRSNFVQTLVARAKAQGPRS